MIIDMKNSCPKCGSTDFSTFYDVQSGGYRHSCAIFGCQQVWEFTNPYLGKKVKIIQPNSPWKNEIGRISEIRNDTKYNVRVKFTINKQVFGDLFNSVYLEEV